MATQASSAKDDSPVKIRVGETEHLIHTKKIPYFKSFLSFQQNSGQNTTSVPAHGDIPFFDVINYGVNNGFRQFFRRMPTQLSDYHVLCEQLEFLAVNVLEDRKLRDIMGDMRRGTSAWGPQVRREILGRKNLARDSVFRLLYTFLLADFESDMKDSSMAYQATLCVVSHYAIFKYRTRKMVREAFEERFVVSEKQLKRLNEWPIKEPTPERWQDGDVTTEVEGTYYDSDWSL